MEDAEIEYYMKAVVDNYPSLLELVINYKLAIKNIGLTHYRVILLCANNQPLEVLWELDKRRFTEAVVRAPNVRNGNRIHIHTITLP